MPKGKGRFKFSKEQESFLKENYQVVGANKCSEILGISISIIKHKAYELGLKFWNSKPWTAEEEEVLQENYPKYGGPYCAKLLRRTLTATNRKASALGCLYIPKHWHISPQGYKMLVLSSGEITAEHRVIMEGLLGRKLLSTEIVHHVNGNKLDNSPDNLILTNRSAHIDEHRADLLEAKRNKYNIVRPL